MITFLRGQVVEASPLRAVLEVGGVGYEVHVPVTTAEKLPPTGGTVRLHTVAVYREDSQSLYGFATTEERDFFRLLIEHVTGVGPKVAIGIMSRLSLPMLEAAIAAGDTGLLSKVPGIGKKTAERLIVELRGKVSATATAAAAGASQATPGSATSAPRPADGGDQRIPDAVLALVALGYKAELADQAVRRAVLALGPKATTEALVKKALAG